MFTSVWLKSLPHLLNDHNKNIAFAAYTTVGIDYSTDSQNNSLSQHCPIQI